MRQLRYSLDLLQVDSGEEGPGLRAKAIAASLNIRERTERGHFVSRASSCILTFYEDSCSHAWFQRNYNLN